MKKILIADDSMFMRESLKSILEKAGYKRISTAENGKKHLNFIKVKDLTLHYLI